MERVNAAKVPSASASDAIAEMRAKGMIDLGARITGEPGFRLVPLMPGREEDAVRMGFGIVVIP